jgi:2-dehydropantoate 2-reductase
MKIAIVGPGAIGGAVAAWLTVTGRHELVLCARTPFERLRVDAGDRVFESSPVVLTAPRAAPKVDWVIVATKTYDVEGAAVWLRALRGADTQVAVLQNGVEHVERFRPHVPERCLVPVVIDCPVERIAPGSLRQRGAAFMVVAEGQSGRTLASMFDATEVTLTLTADFATALWKKLCFNVAGVVPALLGTGDGVARDDAIAEVMRDLVREAVDVGRAEGAQLHDATADKVVAAFRGAPIDRINSLTADRRAGRRTEIDARNGAVVRIGRKHGIATPLNAMAVALMKN